MRDVADGDDLHFCIGSTIVINEPPERSIIHRSIDAINTENIHTHDESERHACARAHTHTVLGKCGPITIPAQYWVLLLLTHVIQIIKSWRMTHQCLAINLTPQFPLWDLPLFIKDMQLHIHVFKKYTDLVLYQAHWCTYSIMRLSNQP